MGLLSAPKHHALELEFEISVKQIFVIFLKFIVYLLFIHVDEILEFSRYSSRVFTINFSGFHDIFYSEQRLQVDGLGSYLSILASETR